MAITLYFKSQARPLTFLDYKSFWEICKRCRPIQTPQLAASELGQHCLLTGISMQNTVKIKTSLETSHTRNELIQMIRIDKSNDLKSLNIFKF